MAGTQATPCDVVIQDTGASSAPEYERWEVIHHDLYAISTLGRLMRTVNAFGNPSCRLLSDRPNVDGYVQSDLAFQNINTKARRHNLVAKAFLGPCPQGHEVNHKDGNKANNHVDNLEYVTSSGNRQHSFHNGLNKCKITEDDVRMIRDKAASGMLFKDIAAQHGCCAAYVGDIVAHKWRKIPWRKQ